MCVFVLVVTVQLQGFAAERKGEREEMCVFVLVVTVQLQGFAAERKGEREEMQDAHVIIDDFSTFVNSDNP